MSPPKQPPKTEAQALSSDNILLRDFFEKKKHHRGISKKRYNMADDIIAVLSVNKAKRCQPPSQTENSAQNPNPHPPKTKAVVANHTLPTITKVTRKLSRAN